MDQASIEYQKLQLAAIEELAQFFRISTGAIPGLMAAMEVPRRGLKYTWTRIWIALGIELGSVQDGAVAQIWV